MRRFIVLILVLAIDHTLFARTVIGDNRQVSRQGARTERYSVTGRVVRENGTPIPKAKVSFKADLLGVDRVEGTAAPNDILATTVTDDQGRFALSDVELKDEHISHIDPVVIIQPPQGALTWAYCTKYQLDLKDIVVRPGTTIRGQLLTEDKKPLAGAKVRVQNLQTIEDGRVIEQGFEYGVVLERSKLSIRATTDKEGRFVIEGLPPNYLVRMLIERTEFSGALVRAATMADPPKEVDEESETPARIYPSNFTATIPRGKILRGRITLRENGQPVARLPIILHDRGYYRGHLTGKTDDRGVYEINEIYGEQFDWQCDPPPESLLPDLVGTELYLTKPINEIDFHVLKTTPVKGIVVDQQTGRGIAGVSVQFEEHREPLNIAPGIDIPQRQQSASPIEIRPNYDPTQTDAHGEFTLQLPDQKGLKGIVEIYGKAAPYWLPARKGLSHRLEPFRRAFASNSQSQPLKFSLNRGLTVKGRVTDSDGIPIAHAQVVECTRTPATDGMRTDDEGTIHQRMYESVRLAPTGLSAITATDDEGNYTLTNVAPDSDYTYVLAAREWKKLKGLSFVRELAVDPQLDSAQHPGGTRIKYDYRRLPPVETFNIDIKVFPTATAVVVFKDKGPQQVGDRVRIFNPLPIRDEQRNAKVAGRQLAIESIAVTPPLAPIGTIDAQGNLVIINLLADSKSDLLVRLIPNDREKPKLKMTLVIPPLKPGELRQIPAGNWLPVGEFEEVF